MSVQDRRDGFSYLCLCGGTCPKPGYRCTPGGRCVRIGGTGGTTGCSCERNKLIVEGGSPVESMEACQLKCLQRSTCKFFTYNPQSRICGLRTFTPGSRAFSFGNLSGLRNESPSVWREKLNSVYVGKLVTAYSCQQCSNLCKADSQCKSMIYNNLYKQCSFNYGTGTLRTIALPSIFNCFGISSAKNC